jgi:hypothetical protein
MQRLSDRDLSGHVIRAGGYDHLRLPTEYEVDAATTTSIGFRDPRRVHMGGAGFAGQHQQRPTPAGGGMLKKHWWR